MNQVSARAGRKSRTQWVELMAAYEAGDLSQREFCEQHDVAYSTFGYWRKRLRSPVTPLEPASEPLLELSPLTLEATRDWRVELDLGSGLVLRLR
jgi:hypothetical protein